MIPMSGVVRRILAAPAPVLFPDTCALLDLMRDPTREGFFSPDQIEAALRLLLRVEGRPGTLWLPIAHQVMIERGDDQAGVKGEAETNIRKFEDRVERVQGLLAAYGLETKAITPTLVASNYPDTASSIVDRYFLAGLHVRNPHGIEAKAYARIAANLAPSKRGQQAKDCIVIETYMRLAAQLRAGNFQGKIVFLTTNKNDYSQPMSRGTVHSELAAEFNAVKMTYAVDFRMAEHQLA